MLLAHYSRQWKNREVYWTARLRSQIHRDLLCIICDSYDESKLQVPKWPWRRCPKRAVYEITKTLRVAWLVDVSVSAVSSLAGVTLTLTCVLAHGHRAYFFFCDEAMSAGSN